MRKLIVLIPLISVAVFVMAGAGASDVSSQLDQAEILMSNRQYEQAEEIYREILADYPGGDAACEAQKQLVIIYIATGNQPQADTALEQLLACFSGHDGIPEALWQVAREYEKFEKYEKAFELYEYDVENFAGDIHAMMSQTGIVKCHIRDGNDAAADAAFDALLTIFADEPTLHEQIHYVARKYEEHEKYDKALDLYRYNVENFPNDKYTMRSQVRIVRTHIRDGNDTAADEAFEKLLTSFSDQPTLCTEVYKIATKYSAANNKEKASQLYQYVIDTWSSDVDIDSRKFVVMSYISLGRDAEVQAGFEALTEDFKDDPDLPLVLWQAADAYYGQAFRYGNEGLEERSAQYFSSVIAIGENFIEESPQHPDIAEVHTFVAICCEQIGEYQRAIEHFQKLADEYPDHKRAAYAQFKVGNIYQRRMVFSDICDSDTGTRAREAYERLITEHPDSKWADIAREKVQWIPEPQKDEGENR